MDASGFTDSCACVVEKENQSIVTSTDRSCAVRLPQKHLHISGIQKTWRCRRVSLGRYRDDARQPSGVLGVATQDMREEAAKRCSPAITCRYTVVPIFFQVVQKCEDQIGIKIHDAQSIDRKASNAPSVLEQQTQRVAIAPQSARTASSRQLKIVNEEGLDRVK
jgi:hypothetical protein